MNINVIPTTFIIADNLSLLSSKWPTFKFINYFLIYSYPVAIDIFEINKIIVT